MNVGFVLFLVFLFKYLASEKYQVHNKEEKEKAKNLPVFDEDMGL